MEIREPDLERVRRGAAILREAERPIRVLRTVAWGPEVRDEFFLNGARELPRVAYKPPNPAPTIEAVAAARALLDPGHPLDQWLVRQAGTIEASALMLAAVGTPDFYEHSHRIYGAPTDALADQKGTTLDLARELEKVLSSLSHIDIGSPATGLLTAERAADMIRDAVRESFGARAPAVEVVDHLSADALAGSTVIRVRRRASFTERQVKQLIHHEAFVHISTSLNGQGQKSLPILAAGHAGTTRTQEGLAVFAELITGCMDLDRFRRLSDRVLAIQMAIEGGSFLDVYRFFLERDGDPAGSFEATRRVFRGGVLEGGAPFTKDGVYLDGLLRVHNFLRTAVSAGRADCLRLIFCGKLDIEDLPALCHLTALGLCLPAVFLPPWAVDLGFLISYLAYSSFGNQVNLQALRQHYVNMLAEAPVATGVCAVPGVNSNLSGSAAASAS